MKIHPPFEPHEVQKLFKVTAGGDAISLRDRALISVLLDSGTRLEDAAKMRVGDVGKDGVFIVKEGKGGKDRPAWLSATPLKALHKWERIRGGKPGEPLWVGLRGYLLGMGLHSF